MFEEIEEHLELSPGVILTFTPPIVYEIEKVFNDPEKLIELNEQGAFTKHDDIIATPEGLYELYKLQYKEEEIWFAEPDLEHVPIQSRGTLKLIMFSLD